MFSADASDLSKWTSPTRILDAKQIGSAPGFYPQVFGTAAGETDSLAGQFARLFVKGVSKWQLTFYDPILSEDESDGAKLDHTPLPAGPAR
jgi:hypothetical protein